LEVINKMLNETVTIIFPIINATIIIPFWLQILILAIIIFYVIMDILIIIQKFKIRRLRKKLQKNMNTFEKDLSSIKDKHFGEYQ